MTPQGLVAVCRRVDKPLTDVLAAKPTLVAVLVDANDPGNAGTILRTADAAGADAVIFAGDSVDIYNGKTVRATAGSLFHLDVVIDVGPDDVLREASRHRLTTIAATGSGRQVLDEAVTASPTVWLFGNEANGLPRSVIDAADRSVRVPIYGRAESLNLAAAAAICLYASATTQRRESIAGSVITP